MSKDDSIQKMLQKILDNQEKIIEATASLPAISSKSLDDLKKKISIGDSTEFSLYDYYSLTRRDDVLISYKGPVTDVILAEISRDIRHKFSDNPRLSKKLFAVFIELAQNILYYSSEKVYFGDRNDSIGTILITRYTDHHTFSCGNLVENKYIDELVEGCETINTLDRDGLREYKRATRSGPKKDRSKGAGIGLIQVALTSGEPLNVEAVKVDDAYSFFSLSVKIKV